jgi:hypothetical protein
MTIKTLGKALRIFSLLIIFTPCVRAVESDLRPLTTAQVLELSQVAVHAKCTGSETRKLADGNLFTFSDFTVVEQLKGPGLGTRFTLRLLGGELDGVVVDAPFLPRFSAGDEVILFLGKENALGYRTIFPQGVFRVLSAPPYKLRIVEPMPSGITLYNSKNGKPYIRTPNSLSLDDFILSLRKAQ